MSLLLCPCNILERHKRGAGGPKAVMVLLSWGKILTEACLWKCTLNCPCRLLPLKCGIYIGVIAQTIVGKCFGQCFYLTWKIHDDSHWKLHYNILLCLIILQKNHQLYKMCDWVITFLTTNQQFPHHLLRGNKCYHPAVGVLCGMDTPEPSLNTSAPCQQ